MSPTQYKIPTKYDNLLLIYIFKTDLSNFFFKGKLWHLTQKKKKKKTSSHAQSTCDEASLDIYEKCYIFKIFTIFS